MTTRRVRGRSRPLVVIVALLVWGVVIAFAQNGGYPASVPTNVCPSCGVRYPTKASDAQTYGVETWVVHKSHCNGQPSPSPSPSPTPSTTDQSVVTVDNQSSDPASTGTTVSGVTFPPASVAVDPPAAGSDSFTTYLRTQLDEARARFPLASFPLEQKPSPSAAPVTPLKPDFWAPK